MRITIFLFNGSKLANKSAPFAIYQFLKLLVATLNHPTEQLSI